MIIIIDIISFVKQKETELVALQYTVGVNKTNTNDIRNFQNLFLVFLLQFVYIRLESSQETSRNWMCKYAFLSEDSAFVI